MSAMHHDTSSDLKVVGKKLKDILEVRHFFEHAENTNMLVGYINIILQF